MAQITTVIKGAPEDLQSALTTLSASSAIKSVQKTLSNGSYLVLSDNSASTGQVVTLVSGDPNALVAALSALIAAGKVIDFVSRTFSAARYLVVYT